MTSQIRVDEITNRSGLGTVTIYDNGFEFTGVTTFTEDVDITGGLTIGGVLTYEDVTNIDSVGLITARAGIRVTGDSIHVESSEDRLLYLKSTDANAYLTFEDTDSSSAFANRVGTVSDGLYFSTGGGGERVRITSAGEVQARRTRSNTVGDVALSIQPTDSSIHYGFRIDNANNNLNIDRVGTGNFITIAADGNIGIGTDSPTQELEINNVTGGASLLIRTSPSTSGGNLLFGDDASDTSGRVGYVHTSDYMFFSTNGSERLRITSGGDVVIGHTSASRGPLHIHKSSADCYFHMTNSTSGTGASNGFTIHQSGDDTLLNNRQTGHLRFYTSGTERLRITSAGFVGINEGSPSTHLHVEQDNAHSSTYYLNSDAAILVDNKNASGKSVIKLEHDAAIVWGGSGNSIIFSDRETERLRITSGGDVLIGGQSAYTYDDTGASNTILDVWNSGNNKRGILSLSGNTNGGASIGTIWFNNDNNSGASPGNNMKLSAAIQSQAVTSDSNAGNDAGATLQFLTKPEGSPMVESMRITSDGDIYQRNQRVHTCLHTEYRQLSGGVNTDSVGSFVDIKNFGYTPKRAGSLIVCHFQVQTWNGSASNMNGDIYFRARFDQGTGNYVSVTYGGNNNRMTGNLDQDSNRQHLFYTHTFGFIAQNTNSHTINLQASNGSSLSTDFNWFHTGDNANGCWIFEYDQ